MNRTFHLRIRRRRILALAPRATALLAWAFAACVTVAHAKAPAAVEFDPAMPAQAGAQSLIQAADASAMRGLQRVAIAAFNVEFVTTSTASAQARELGRSGTAGVNVAYRLTGPTPQDMQTITDALHAQFRQQLQAAGIEPVPVAQVRAAAAWRKLAEGGQPAPYERGVQAGRSQIYTADAVPVWGLAATSTGNPLAVLAGVGQAFTSTVAVAELTNELAVPTLSVDMRVDFAQLQSNTSSFLGRMSGTAEVQAKVSLTLTQLNATLTLPGGGGTALTLAQPLVLQGDAFDGVKDVSSVAGNVALAVLSMAIGNGGSQSAKDMEAQADPTRFRAVVQSNLGAVGGMLALKLGGRT